MDVSRDCISCYSDDKYDFSFGSDNSYSSSTVNYINEPENNYVFVKKLERK